MTEPAQPTCYRHRDRPTYIRCVRCERPICPDCMRPASVGFHCPEEASAPKVRSLPTGGVMALRQAAPVTFGLIVVNLAVFVAEVLTGAGLGGDGGGTVVDHLQQVSGTFRYGGQGVIPGIADGQYWRLFTSMFVHYGVLHIALNMYSLFVLGLAIERRLGAARYLGLYLLSGLGGAVLSYLFLATDTPSGGASGAIFGLFAAYAVAARRERLPLGPIASLLVINVALSFLPGIGLLAHLGGLLVGAGLAAVVEYTPRRRQRAAVAASFALVLVALVALTAARTHVLRDRDRIAAAPVSRAATDGRHPAATAAPRPPTGD